jgi:hypothetical protein
MLTWMAHGGTGVLREKFVAIYQRDYVMVTCGHPPPRRPLHHQNHRNLHSLHHRTLRERTSVPGRPDLGPHR